MDALADTPMFSEQAPKFHQRFEKADVFVAHNVGFDLDMMRAKSQRAGSPPINVAEKLVIDPHPR